MVTRFLCLLSMLLALCAGEGHAAGAQQQEPGATPRALEGMSVAWEPVAFDIHFHGYGGLLQPKLPSTEIRQRADATLDELLQMFGRRISADMDTALNRVGIARRPAETARWRITLQPSEGYYAPDTRLKGVNRSLTIQASLYDVTQAKVIWTDTQKFWGVTSTQEGDATVLEFADKLVDVMRRYLP